MAAARDARVRSARLRGWRAIVLETPLLSLTVIPARGGEIRSIFHRELGIELLFHAPWDLSPPGALPAGEGEPWLAGYAGGWQLLAPNVGNRCRVRGREVPMHGELAARGWRLERAGADRGRASCRLAVECGWPPLAISREIELEAGSAHVRIRDRIANRAKGEAAFCWGQHLVLGAPLVGPGATLELPAGGRVTTLEDPVEEGARLLPGQSASWPTVRARDGGDPIDLSLVPGPEVAAHDDAFVEGLTRGTAVLANPALELAVELRWPVDLLPALTLWQAYGGAATEPLGGLYCLGIEPWSSRHNLADAIAAGEESRLAPGEELEARIELAVRRPERRGESPQLR